jgi:hypothetical protein
MYLTGDGTSWIRWDWLAFANFFDTAVAELDVQQPMRGDDPRPQFLPLRISDYQKVASQDAIGINIPTAVASGDCPCDVYTGKAAGLSIL